MYDRYSAPRNYRDPFHECGRQVLYRFISSGETTTTDASTDWTSIPVGSGHRQFLRVSPPSSSAGGLWTLTLMKVDATGTRGRPITKVSSKVGSLSVAIVTRGANLRLQQRRRFLEPPHRTEHRRVQFFTHVHQRTNHFPPNRQTSLPIPSHTHASLDRNFRQPSQKPSLHRTWPRPRARPSLFSVPIHERPVFVQENDPLRWHQDKDCGRLGRYGNHIRLQWPSDLHATSRLFNRQSRSLSRILQRRSHGRNRPRRPHHPLRISGYG